MYHLPQHRLHPNLFHPFLETNMALSTLRLTGVSARIIGCSTALALFSLTPLVAKEPIGSITEMKKKQEAVCLRSAGESVSKGQKPRLATRFAEQAAQSIARRGVSMEAAVAQNYTLAQLSSMSYATMIDNLTAPGMTWENVTDLWSYSASCRTFYSDTYRVQALIDAIQSRAGSFTATDNKGIPTLAEVVRAGFYHGWYHPAELGALNDRNTHNKCLPAIRQAQANPNFSFNNTAGCEVAAAMGLLIANGSCDPGIVRNFQSMLSQFNTNFATWAGDFAKGTAWFNICNGIDADLYNDVRNNGQVDPATLSEWYGQINYFLDEIFNIASKPATLYTTDNDWAIDAAIYYASRAGKFHSTTGRSLQVITDAMNRYGKTPWKYASAQSAQMIHYNYNDTDYYGNKLNWPQIQEEIRTQYLPVTRRFDGGLFTTRFGNAVSLEKMKTLIWAHKETKAQFFRSLGADTPADPKQTSDNSLQIIVYNTPEEYRMNGVAYGLDTNNGGMYIEGDGTFYTYERTPQDSIYSLEELFRHEGVHYLQGRYLVPGEWGYSSLYDGNRLTWIEEGGAEWHAGATRTSGIKNRPTKTAYIPTDLSSRMTIAELIKTGYGSFAFYDYGNNLLDFLYNTGKQDTYLNMASALRANNAANFDSLASGLTSYESAYQNHLTLLLNNSGTFPAPFTAPDYLATHPAKTIATVQSEITAATGLTGVTISTTKDTDWSTFTLRGTYTGTTSAGLLTDWTNMGTKVDGWLNTLSANSWSGYKTLTGYFINYRKDASNRVVYDVVFHGICTDSAVANNKDPKAVISAPATGTPNQAISFSGTGSSDPDGTLSSYSWTFSDGGTATGVAVSKSFTKPGNYTASLTVADNFGATNTATHPIKLEYNTAITAEWESNDTPAEACGPLGSGVAVSATLGGADNKDYFFFDVVAGGDISIAMAMTGTVTCTWQLFHESDLNTNVAYMSDPTTVYTVPANKTGRYYLMPYTFGAGNSYTIKVTGANIKIGGGTTPTAPVISGQPASQTVTAPATATFNVTATGTNLTYQWFKRPSASGTASALSGATAASYTTPATSSTDNGSVFFVEVSSGTLKTSSSNATLTVNTTAAPTITTQPIGRTVTAGSTATFSVVASGNSLTYQWQKAASGSSTFANIAGATASSYTTPATTSTDNGAQFRVVVTNASGSTTSSAASLTVSATATAPTITTQPVGKTVTAGSTATFSVVASGANLTYQWQRRAPGATTYSNITGATASGYTTPATTTADNNAAFRVKVVNSAGSVTSSGATLKVTAGTDTTAPVVSLTAPAAGATVTGTATLSASASDNVGVTKVEFYVGTTLVGTDTTAPYSLAWGSTSFANGTYPMTARAYDAANNVTTSAARSITVTNGTTACTPVSGSLLTVGTNHCVPAGSGTQYLYFVVPSGATSVQITTSGGTGNGDLYASPYAWADTSYYSAYSANSGNTETVVTSIPSGTTYFYVSVVGTQSGMSIRVVTQ